MGTMTYKRALAWGKRACLYVIGPAVDDGYLLKIFKNWNKIFISQVFTMKVALKVSTKDLYMFLAF